MFKFLTKLFGFAKQPEKPNTGQSQSGQHEAPTLPEMVSLPLGLPDPLAQPKDAKPPDGALAAPIPSGAKVSQYQPVVAKSIVTPENDIQPKPESAIGPDDRKTLIPYYEDLWYTLPDGTEKSISVPVAPWSAICFLELKFGGKTYHGTGWFVGPRTIMTAAHNLYIRSDTNFTGKPVDSITVHAGKTGAGPGPFGGVVTKTFAFDARYANTPEDRDAAPFDYGAIFLDSDKLGSFVRNYFRFASVSPSANIGTIQVAGYPIDRNDQLVYAEGHQEGKDEKLIVHDVDTERGQSGAPIYHYHPKSGYTVIGIHTDGFGLAANRNVGVRLTPQLVQAINFWIKSPGRKVDANSYVA